MKLNKLGESIYKRYSRKKLTPRQKQLIKEIDEHFKTDGWTLLWDCYSKEFGNPIHFNVLLYKKGYTVILGPKLTVVIKKARKKR
jgi:hypothetical protein